MSRYRPPAPPKSLYITEDGFAALQAESKALWKRRAEVTKALTAAAAEGDRSENAEYIYRKKELRELDRRIRYLQVRLPELKVVRAQPDSTAKVYFGAWVELEQKDSSECCYRIVGPDEINPERGWISIDSPMARALLKKTIDDEVVVKTPTGPMSYYIIDVHYTKPPSDGVAPAE